MIDRFRLDVPSSWLEVEVRPEQREAALDALVEQVAAAPELASHRTALDRALRQQVGSAGASGACWCAAMAEVGEAGPVVATAVAHLVPAPPADGRDLLDAVLAPFSARPPGEGTWRTVERVEVPGAGPAGRTRGVDDVAPADGTGVVSTVVVRTLVPLPGGDEVLVLTCSSPASPLTEDLLDLFDAVSATLEVVTEP